MVNKTMNKDIKPIELTEVQKIRQELLKSLDLAKKQALINTISH
jgi:hypothetical protein